jgi:hypothetical protein
MLLLDARAGSRSPVSIHWFYATTLRDRHCKSKLSTSTAAMRFDGSASHHCLINCASSPHRNDAIAGLSGDRHHQRERRLCGALKADHPSAESPSVELDSRMRRPYLPSSSDAEPRR